MNFRNCLNGMPSAMDICVMDILFFLLFWGGALVLADLYRWHTEWLYIVGLGIAAFGGYSAQAYLLKIRPFEDPPYPPKWLDKRKDEGEK